MQGISPLETMEEEKGFSLLALMRWAEDYFASYGIWWWAQQTARSLLAGWESETVAHEDIGYWEKWSW